MESMGKILLVDDEINVLKALVRLLDTEPYEVVTALSGREALEVLKKDSSLMSLLPTIKCQI